MSAKDVEKRSGLSRAVIWFFVFAIAVVAAFLIIGLVRTCEAEHEEKEVEKALQEEVTMISNPDILNTLA